MPHSQSYWPGLDGYNREITVFVRGIIFSFLALLLPTACADDGTAPRPLEWEAKDLVVHFGGFVDWISEWRSASYSDNIYTHFSRIPLTDTPDDFLTSAQHSRGKVKAEMPLGNVKFTGYYEFDFLDPNQKSDYRTRQVYGEISFGHWTVLAGQAWGLLRITQNTLEPDQRQMNTDVVEAAYHVGLAGSRRQQVRLMRQGQKWSTAVSVERRTEKTGSDFLWKLVRDTPRVRLDGAVLVSGAGRRALSIGAIVPFNKHVRYVTQEYVGRHAGYEALSIVPLGVSGGSTIHGIEATFPRGFEVYSYGGLVYGAHSSGNRLAREWTVGGLKKTKAPGGYGFFHTGVQYSQMDRHTWLNRAGEMNYVQAQIRYTLW